MTKRKRAVESIRLREFELVVCSAKINIEGARAENRIGDCCITGSVESIGGA